jgi:hypothetical protein
MGEVRELNERKIEIGAFAITPSNLAAELVTLQSSVKDQPDDGQGSLPGDDCGWKSAGALVKEKGLEQPATIRPSRRKPSPSSTRTPRK